jgi:hypothetical protein
MSERVASFETSLRIQTKQINEIHEKLIGTDGVPGWCVRLDRLEQTVKFFKRMFWLFVTPLYAWMLKSFLKL